MKNTSKRVLELLVLTLLSSYCWCYAVILCYCSFILVLWYLILGAITVVLVVGLQSVKSYVNCYLFIVLECCLSLRCSYLQNKRLVLQYLYTCVHCTRCVVKLWQNASEDNERYICCTVKYHTRGGSASVMLTFLFVIKLFVCRRLLWCNKLICQVITC